MFVCRLRIKDFTANYFANKIQSCNAYGIEGSLKQRQRNDFHRFTVKSQIRESKEKSQFNEAISPYQIEF